MSYPDIKLLRDEDLTQEMEDFMMVEKETFSSLGLRTRMLNRVKILQQYILNKDELPPLTMDYKELIHIVRQIMSPNGGDISVKSNTNSSVATSTTGFPDNVPATVLALKELKIKDIPTFSGDFDDWIDWYNPVKNALGNNRWLGTAYKVGELNDNEKAISNSIFYQLAFATKESTIWT